jgi:histidyl-tRNA synthetase
MSQRRTFQAPKGTRDFYPEELLRRRYIAEQWRAASIRHGFDEIDGPTFEHAELYTVKSGEGILSELFSFTREGGDDRYALRPEFTPTLARLYAAQASALPKPVRWFCIPNFFRAEKPQRGRLREFFQWNADVIGEGTAEEDAEVIACLVGVLDELGLGDDIRVHLNNRDAMGALVAAMGVDEDEVGSAFVLLDRRDRLNDDALEAMAFEFGTNAFGFLQFLKRPRGEAAVEAGLEHVPQEAEGAAREFIATLRRTQERLEAAGIGGRCVSDLNVVRGLAYYTGTVFEVIAEGERAVAGGGRYDKLIELFGGPSTPACGFGMGDVVLGNLLDDRNLMPEGKALREAIDRTVRGVSLRPEVFVVGNGDEEAEALVRPLLARLRRGVEGETWLGREGRKPWDAGRYAVRPLHARTTGKRTRNIKKLLTEAEKLGAKLAAIVHGPDKVQLKALDRREDVGDFAVEPLGARNALGEVAYVGGAAQRVLDGIAPEV